jgi:hypothetical protein
MIMKKSFISAIVFLTIMLLYQPVKSENDWSIFPITLHVCQDCDPQIYYPQHSSIIDAVAAAKPGDTINIWGEYSCRDFGRIHEYNEAMVIDKQLTLTCDNPHPELGLPIISHDFRPGTADAVITLLPGAEGTIIKNLHVRGPKTGLVTDCDSDIPFDCMKTKAGIRIAADACRVEGCEITRCMTGIYITGMNNTVQECRIGTWWRGVVAGDWYLIQEWQPLVRGQVIDHTGNGFGIVVIEPLPRPEDSRDLIRAPNTIQDNTFRGNRYTEIVEIGAVGAAGGSEKPETRE